MDRRTFILSMLAGLGMAATQGAFAQGRPTPIRIVYPFPGGGSGDALTRLLADRLATSLQRPVIVEPRPGAAGRLGVQFVKGSEPDGSTLLMSPIAPMAVYQDVYASLEYDPVRDFAPIAQVATFEFGAAVGAHVPVRTLAELVSWLKENPKEANFGTPGAGTLNHFFGIMFARAAGVMLQHVPYKGGSAAIVDLMGGRIPIVFQSVNELIEPHKSGRARVLATSNAQRSDFLPEVPTFKEAGFDIEGTGWFGLFAPSKTPAAVVERLSAAVGEALADEGIKARVRSIGLRPTGTTAEAFARIQQNDIARWAPAVKASGFTPEQ
jgi:tripartite-type tricarboxylate transporter receptor subunit TctC